MRYVWLLSTMLFPFAVYAERIPDLSLPVDESLRQPNNPGTLDRMPRDNYGQYFNRQQNSSYGSGRGYDPRGYSDNGLSSEPGKLRRFMDGFCDTGYQGEGSGLMGCLAQQKQQACQEFQQLPADAQRVLDDAIGCAWSTTSGDAAAAQNAATDPACTENDARRLQLLHKYWDDQATAHALVFLPDQALGSGNCLRGNGRY